MWRSTEADSYRVAPPALPTVISDGKPQYAASKKFQIAPTPWDINHAKVVVHAATGNTFRAKALMPKMRKKVLPYKSAK
jgi:hypothetical protein